MSEVTPNKKLGQHWLRDKAALSAVIEAADISAGDYIVEIGPGLGTLTELLLQTGAQVLAVELDRVLALSLKSSMPSDRLHVIEQDILKLDLTQLPPGYKVVANIPYYLTSNLLRVLAESPNPPAKMSLLVQKEVAERIAAGQGQMSLLAVSVQMYYKPKLGRLVPAKLFTPPPKVDSQIISLERLSDSLFDDIDTKQFFRIVKAGFAGRRKKLRSSLAAGLQLSKQEADELLARAGIDGDLRAQALTLQQWLSLYRTLDQSPSL